MQTVYRVHAVPQNLDQNAVQRFSSINIAGRGGPSNMSMQNLTIWTKTLRKDRTVSKLHGDNVKKQCVFKNDFGVAWVKSLKGFITGQVWSW